MTRGGSASYDGAMHILLIEDNPHDVELARVALARCGLPVELVAVPDEAGAVDFLLRRGAHVDRPAGAPAVVFLDLVLEESRGVELIATIRAHDRLAWVPIVMLTTSHSPRDIAECYRRGANAYMVKPLSLGEFAENFARALRFWTQINTRVE